MAKPAPTEYFIQGITESGKRFRPSDWSERLCGVMSGFGPKAKGPNAYMQYSIYVRPTMVGDTKAVILDARLRDVEPMAFDFVLNFAKDNELVVSEACELPLPHGRQSKEGNTRTRREATSQQPPSQFGANQVASELSQCKSHSSNRHAQEVLYDAP
jgi:hypothetical protein